uniref:Uncharacterized protein n=1 Tax=Siphoviridae sp. ctxMM9 TaxID=2827973 RepID=A0A8S5T835_9CAUD|nr:MAG TPA: hypothetical protein [Siphoviridae sp. ctxMM9]
MLADRCGHLQVSLSSAIALICRSPLNYHSIEKDLIFPY